MLNSPRFEGTAFGGCDLLILRLLEVIQLMVQVRAFRNRCICRREGAQYEVPREVSRRLLGVAERAVG